MKGEVGMCIHAYYTLEWLQVCSWNKFIYIYSHFISDILNYLRVTFYVSVIIIFYDSLSRLMPTSSIKLSFYIWMLRVIFIEVKMIFLRMQFPYSYQIKVALSSRKECLELKFWGRIKKQSPPYPPDSAECCPPSWSNGRLRPLASATWSNKPNTWKSYKIQEKKNATTSWP